MMILSEIANYANNNGYYIMSDDSDMFVMTKKGMIFIQDCKRLIRHPEMKLRYYSRKLFMRKHKINYSQLLYLGILNGNDFTELTSLRRVFHLEEDEKQTFDMKEINTLRNIPIQMIYKKYFENYDFKSMSYIEIEQIHNDFKIILKLIESDLIKKI